MGNIVIADDSRNTVFFVHIKLLDQVQYMGIVYFQTLFTLSVYWNTMVSFYWAEHSHSLFMNIGHTCKCQISVIQTTWYHRQTLVTKH